ncbi:oxidoreductase molybdopterin [Helicosporidium sp. ATCC 50920]|nr:oxidoreductase molybdopterin [Helicosporidium sp. ATCC 50920]|eukprot:KDD77101.1 oxidoreductase molybdopterin [Helicosporidium sp. ATCC 50920]
MATERGLVLQMDVHRISLPVYTKEEVAKHRTKETGIWVTYKDGVYDVTEWAAIHPGGEARIMMAAGAAIDPFWAMYQQHNTAQVRDILEGYRIGRLEGGPPPPPSDPYANEPKDRLPVFIVRSSRPMNAEPPLELLSGSLITPTELFYVRNHLPVPDIKEAEYKLTIAGEGVRHVEFSLEDLKTKFRSHTIAAVVQCSGNRRNEFYGVKEVQGLEWGGGALGNATWTGVKLSDVLAAAGLEANPDGSAAGSAARHVQFEGADNDGAGLRYAASIPLYKALNARGDVLLAYEMNGKPLTRDHGAPVRVVVPGAAGCRSVKWLERVVLSAEESSSQWQRKDYKGFSPNVDWDNVDWDSAPPIDAMPVTSMICEPKDGSSVDVTDDTVALKGYAWSGNGQKIVRVDVSCDGGQSWQTAELEQVPQEYGRAWAWSLWTLELELPKNLKVGQTLDVVVKATDESYNTQPQKPDGIWNLRGVLCNSWHTIKLCVADD